MMDEWRAFETTPTSPSVLFRGTDYEDFLKIIEQNTVSNQLGVPATFFFFMDDDHIRGGYIGYGLRPSAKGRGLSREMLRLGLIEAGKLEIEKVLISAHEDNIASWKTIESCGGEYIKTIPDGERNLKVYWIHL